jgi:DEAD/DEAH box helicase domain-containing protein
LNRTLEYIQALRQSPVYGPQVAAYHLLSGRPARFEPIPEQLCPAVRAMLRHMGVEQLYSHQVEALAAIARGIHTVVATPTASGKSLIYNVPVWEAIARDARAHALYIFPLKALAQDQLKTFVQASRRAEPMMPTAAIYDGDTSAYQRRKIRARHPNVLMTNPEMLHLALLAHHEQWQAFFRRLQLVVIDEVHTCRGMLGAHMAQVMRRLRRICDHYGASPTFVFTSATVANPGQLAGDLTGLEVRTVEAGGAPRGSRHIALIDPQQGAAQTAIALLKAALARDLRTIVYTQSRALAERIVAWVQGQSGHWGEKISVYRAGLMPEDRRVIEQRLKTGELLAVVSTSALELGIDIGDLDICILVGYPGSMTATWQRSGRVGRQGQDAGLVMIAAENALDHYFVAHPTAFWQGAPETAVLNPFNPVALEAHLECAAAELPLAVDEAWLTHPEVYGAMNRLEAGGTLRRTADGASIHACRRRPHLTVSLRGAGQRYRIVDADAHTTIGEIDGYRLYRETHPGAIYLHQAQTFQVQSIDEKQRAVRVRRAQVDYYTRVRGDSDVSIIEVREQQQFGGAWVGLGMVRVTDRITGYEQIRISNGRTLMQIALDVPPMVFETEAVWFRIPADIIHSVSEQGYDPLGALHAAEHAAIAIMPLLVLADRNDIGGLSTAWHPQTGGAAIFIYDGVPGGAGFSRQAFAQFGGLLEHTHNVIADCACDSGCPACIHSPKCGSGNNPIDKAGALAMVRALRTRLPSDAVASGSSIALSLTAFSSTPLAPPLAPLPPGPPPSVIAPAARQAPLRYGVFDLETQRSALEVGGWHMAHQMRMSCGVVYDSFDDTYCVYLENEVDALIDHLRRFDRVVGYNIGRFDYKVLSAYSDFDFSRLPSLDLLTLIYDRLGFRLSLDHMAEATLGVKKTGSGLDALRWWKEGRMEEIICYCRSDVRITGDLYRFAGEHGYLIYREREGMRFRVPLRF